MAIGYYSGQLTCTHSSQHRVSTFNIKMVHTTHSTQCSKDNKTMLEKEKIYRLPLKFSEK